MATKKRNLADLFQVGKELELDDGQGEPVKVWLQKLNPVEHEKAMRRASSARAKILSGKDAAEQEMAEDEAAEIGREGWIEYLTTDALSRRVRALEAELAAEEEWSKDKYLQGLRDAWDDGMQDTLAEDPDDAEAVRVRDELARFQTALDALIEGERENIRRDYESKDDDDLERRVVERLISTRADLAWLTEFRRCEVWLAVRDPKDHLSYMFDERGDVDRLSQEVLVRLMTAYQELSVDPQEGKASRATRSSSKSSESPVVEETDQASGLEVVIT